MQNGDENSHGTVRNCLLKSLTFQSKTSIVITFLFTLHFPLKLNENLQTSWDTSVNCCNIVIYFLSAFLLPSALKLLTSLLLCLFTPHSPVHTYVRAYSCLFPSLRIYCSAFCPLSSFSSSHAAFVGSVWDSACVGCVWRRSMWPNWVQKQIAYCGEQTLRQTIWLQSFLCSLPVVSVLCW